ncbi:diguanylate cyclase domain-containing protein [Streptomyces carpaticus]|uniref:GGDEF domain-containing protein n=1 Tax=Streptomyces carpaticus TaxID=285558 RepID=UPI003D15CAF8
MDASRVRAVAALVAAMAGAVRLPEVARAAAEGARTALGGSFAALSVWERERGRLRVLVNTGRLVAGEEEFPADESYAVRDFPEIALASPHEPRAWVERADGPRRGAALRRQGRGCCVAAPVVLADRAWGELYVARDAGLAVFTPDEAEFAAVLASVTATGLAQYERLERVRRLAFTDPLTGLGNRRAVDERLAEAVAAHRSGGEPLVLVVCDVNGLKKVNDTYGHAAGDRLLERFGRLLSLCAAAFPGALAARLGGDEFALVVTGHPDTEVEAAVAGLCRGAAGLALGEGVACGIAGTGEGVGPPPTARRLFRLADAAQYRAKATHAPGPVVAGRGAEGRAALRMADAPAAYAPGEPERRRFRGRE